MWVAVVWALLAPMAPGSAQEALPRGRVIPRVDVVGDPTQAYALYVPANEPPGKTGWPLLILMDPRGRAQAPLERVTPAAERLGFVVASSYGTRSDGPVEPNVRALNALLADLPLRMAVDPSRVYLAGFSGTARFAWEAAERLEGNVPGVLGVGAGPVVNDPERLVLLTLQGVPFDYVGAVGDADYNFHEVLALEARLEERSIPHRFEVFEGLHAWPPQEVLDRALTWLELRAVSRGLSQRTPAWIDSVYAAWSNDAERLTEQGRPWQAWRAWRALAGDFREFRDVGRATDRAEALATSPEVRSALDDLRRSENRQVAWDRRYRRVSSDLRSGALPSLDLLLRDLQVPELLAGAAATDAPAEALSHRRILELLFARASFYEPRRYLADGDVERAILMARVAEAAKPRDPQACLTLAGLHAHAGRSSDAIAWLECYAEAPAASPEALEADGLLESLREHPGYRDVVSRLTRRGG